MSKKRNRSPAKAARDISRRLLPSTLLDLPLRHLSLGADLAQRLAVRQLATVGDLLALPADNKTSLADTDIEGVQQALARALHDGLCQVGLEAQHADWTTARAQLEAQLQEPERRLFGALLGLDGAPSTRPAIARQLGLSMLQLDEQMAQLRARLLDRAAAWLGRLRYEMGRGFAAADGLLPAAELAPDSLLHSIARTSGDALLALRLCAFCFPRECHLHGASLFAISPPRFRKLLRTLPRLVAQNRLPLAVDELVAVLAAEGLQVQRQVLLHLLRSQLRITITNDTTAGEICVPDPRSTTTRLADLLREIGQPISIENLVFAYRERFRRANRTSIEQRLRRSNIFVMLGPSTWSLRAWHETELAGVSALVDKVVRRICNDGRRGNVVRMLGEEQVDERTLWLVLDRMAVDPRVRMLGRGEACPAVHQKSQVLEQLLRDFRRAGGDVVLSLFVANQPRPRRRIVERLLRWNRLFVCPAPDRIDLLTNYPFNEDRLRRLMAMLHRELQERAGYAPASALKTAVDRTDLGGSWLTPELLTDLLQRHSRFEVLPGGVIARRDLHLRANLMRTVRQALRDADHPVAVADVLRARPELGEFESCLRDLLRADPLVQASETDYFSLL
ncbi:MAG TPA: hypothetical protein VFZ65_06605 [Planctomycetota bacterium]|nr:hypothetical protein [Planctomycetota bacterium]